MAEQRTAAQGGSEQGAGLLDGRGRGWGGAGALGGERPSGVGEDGAAGEGVLHGGDDTEPAAAARAARDSHLQAARP